MIRDYHIYHFLRQTYRSIEYIFFRLLFFKDYCLEFSIFIITQSIVYETSDHSIGLARKEKKILCMCDKTTVQKDIHDAMTFIFIRAVRSTQVLTVLSCRLSCIAQPSPSK